MYRICYDWTLHKHLTRVVISLYVISLPRWQTKKTGVKIDAVMRNQVECAKLYALWNQPTVEIHELMMAAKRH